VIVKEQTVNPSQVGGNFLNIPSQGQDENKSILSVEMLHCGLNLTSLTFRKKQTGNNSSYTQRGGSQVEDRPVLPDINTGKFPMLYELRF
jgi:hypothetical protein